MLRIILLAIIFTSCRATKTPIEKTNDSLNRVIKMRVDSLFRILERQQLKSEIATDTTNILPTVQVEGTYVMRFYPHDYYEPVSALPLAVILVVGTLLAISLIVAGYEFIKEKLSCPA